MAAPERWWVIAGAPVPHQQIQWKIVQSPTRPTADFVDGPFTKAQAEADYKKRTSPITPPTLPNPLSGLSALGKIGHWIGDAVLHVTDAAMWRSLGWLALGAFLVIAGIYLWFRTSSTYQQLESSITGAVKAL